jgi:major membrane immunogen (membrane-anchored lipoprotein)
MSHYRGALHSLLLLIAIASSAFASVTVSSPTNNATVGTTVHYVASASSTCAKGVSAIGVFTADFVLAYVASGSKLDTSLNLNPGKYQTTVQQWDNCGGTDRVQLTINVMALGGVNVVSPSPNSTVSSPVKYLATASSACSKGVASVGIYTADNVLAYRQNGSALNTALNLNPGTYNTTVQSWDNCGGTAKTPVSITVTDSSHAGVSVTAPANNSTVTSPVNFVASAQSSCAKGVSAMGIYPAAGNLAYKVNGATLDAIISLGNGDHSVVVQEWDNCGGTSTTAVNLTVGSGGSGSGLPSNAKTFVNLHSLGGWQGYALLPPNYPLCTWCSPSGPETTWSWTTGVNSPALSGNATKTTVGGKTIYSDAFWNNKLIGDFSSQGLHDDNKTLVPALHNFVYDVWFYGENLEVSEALEFDLNQFMSGKGFIWGHECRIKGGHEWDIWDNVNEHWIKTGIPCHPVSGKWNHLVLRVERTSDDKVLFKTIELNGQVASVNHQEDNRAKLGWYGVTVNYQIDGDNYQTPYTVYLDKFNFSYW